MADEGTATATAEAPAAPRAATKYVRTDKQLAKEVRGQAKETLDAIEAAGGPVSVSEIAAKCVYKDSRQDKERVAGFYVARFKKEGLIASAPPAA